MIRIFAAPIDKKTIRLTIDRKVFLLDEQEADLLKFQVSAALQELDGSIQEEIKEHISYKGTFDPNYTKVLEG